MTRMHIHKGWLTYGLDHEDHETVKLNDEPVAEELEYLTNHIATVKYFISDKEATEDELQVDFLTNTLYGNLESEFSARYSEYTGYLWTDDELKIGGHDLLHELKSYVGKYLFMVIYIEIDG